MKSFYCFLLLITICQLVASDQVFKATKEWQKVPEGVNIPKGLHVKMDFQTHEKWAKLMDEDGSETEEGVIAMVDPEKPTKVKFEDEKLQALKEEFDKLDHTTPYALMSDLIDDLETNPDPNGQNFEAITDGLDSHFSHIDLARDAVKQGLMSRLLSLYMSKFDDELYIVPPRKIFQLVTAASQNNKPVAEALSDVVYKNIQLVLENSSDEKVLKSVLFSLSAITRSTTASKIETFDFQHAVDRTKSLPEIQKILCDLIADLKLNANCGKSEL